MSPPALLMLAVGVSLLAAGWAGVLALAEESAGVARSFGDPGSDTDARAPGYRRIQLSRLCLLFVAAVTAATAVGWWYRDGPWAPVTAIVTMGFIFMVGEGLPRAVGKLGPELATAAAPVAVRIAAPFSPLSALASLAERAMRRFLPAGESERSSVSSVRRDILLGVFSLGETTVAEIMTPRLDLVALDVEANWSEVIEVVRRSEHSRILVYADALDQITGILYVKDLVAAAAGLEPIPVRWQDLVRRAQFVPESKTLTAQLRDFQRGPAHMAVVVDEFGGTSGIVTLEDTLEEIVGEIHDEYDVDEEPAVEREGEGKFWVDGNVTLDELSALLGIDAERDDVSTVGGFVYSELGHVPRPGEEFRVEDFRVVVEQVKRRRVRRVYFERLNGAPVEQPEE